ncbi:MAG: hypothetical protein R3A48_01895 [Polyangiales bacterium]
MNFMPVIADVRVMPESLDATYSRLLRSFARWATTPGDLAERARAAAPPRAPRRR